jgi:geranyl-CoA carboxylase beta subunit
MITAAKMKRSGKDPDAEYLAGMEKQIKERMDHESHALFGTARLWDDGIIDPRDSRKVLQIVLSLCRESEGRALRPNTFGVARF